MQGKWLCTKIRQLELDLQMFNGFYILIIYFTSMNSLRHQNDASIEEESIDSSDSDVGSSIQRKAGKTGGRPGRPRGKGRPKKSSKLLNRKKSQEEEEWQEKIKVKERVTPGKQQSSIEGYIKIIDYLKKIDYDEASLQNKMNPYNALTATCLWYAISAEYFSLDFFQKKNPHDVAVDILDRVQKLPLLLPNRINKNFSGTSLVPFENEDLDKLGGELADKMNNLIPSALPSRLETIQRKIPISSVAEDDQFISSNRAILYNYINKKIKNSDKWANNINTYQTQIQELPPKDFLMPDPIEFQKEEEPYKETNLFELLRQQAKKKVNRKQKNKTNKIPNQNEIFHQDSAEHEHPENEDRNEQKQNQQQEEQENIIKEKIEFEEAENFNKNLEKLDIEQEEKSLKVGSVQNMENGQQNRIYKKTYNQQDLILDSLLHLPLDKVISILQSSLPTIDLPQIKEDFMPIPNKDPLDFVFQLHPQEEKYLEYMKQYRKRKYRQKVAKYEVTNQQQEKQGQFQDAKCQICTDGDYTDDNLIVFCSMCNISLHQRCVGLAKVPAQSWVCDVCLAFGPAGINLPCPLCNVKGGAMKRTSLHIDTNIFKELNPGYYQYSKKCPYNKQKQEYVPKQKMQGEEQQPGVVKVVREKGEKQEQCYYDYFVKSTYPTTIPTCHYVWVHYVCAIWVPECYFQEKNGVISIKGIENIDKKRFKNECFACKKSRCGAAVKCEDPECDKYYHPECARKKKVYMQQLNLEKLKYLIFCEEHQPLKLTRQIEYKKKKARQQIIKFARMIEKYIQTYRIAQFPYRLMKSAAPSNFIETVVKLEKDESKERRSLNNNSDEEFLKELMNSLSKAKMMTVHLEKVENGYKITNIQTPSKREIRKCLNRYDEFWNSIKNGDTNQQNFRRYQRIMLENQALKEKLQLFLNGTLSIKGKQAQKKQKKVGRKRGKHAVQQVQTLIQQEGGIFCVCKKPYEGETDMLQCQVCGEWYHFRCLSFIGTEQDAQEMEFKCMKCMKFEQDDKKEERLKKYSTLFGPDSILYVYRPPTPDLLSEEQVEHKDYEQIIQQVKKKKQLKATPQKENSQIRETTQQKKYVEGEEIKLQINHQIVEVNIDNTKPKIDQEVQVQSVQPQQQQQVQKIEQEPKEEQAQAKQQEPSNQQVNPEKEEKMVEQNQEEK